MSEKWNTNTDRRVATHFFDALGRPVRTEVDALLGGATTKTKVIRDDVDYDLDGQVLRKYYPYPEGTLRANGATEFDYLPTLQFQVFNGGRRPWRGSKFRLVNPWDGLS